MKRGPWAIPAGAFLAAALLADAGSLNAQEYSPFSAERAGTPQFLQCQSVHATEVDLGRCFAAELDRQNALLKLALNEQLEASAPATRSQIAIAQRTWEAFRSATCRVRSMNGGSGSGIFFLSCMVRETIGRRADLSNAWDY